MQNKKFPILIILVILSLPLVLATPQINLDWIFPTENINVNQTNWFNVTVNISCSIENCGQMNLTLDPSTTIYNFTTCNNAGVLGPTQSQCNTNYTGTSLAGLVTVINGIQYWTAPATGTYNFRIAGASGSDARRGIGGKGRIINGTASLTQGQVLKILVGQKGGFANFTTGDAGGGGGGTFIINNATNSPIIIAGGGGGAGDGHSGQFDYIANGADASTFNNPNGTAGVSTGGSWSSAGAGGTNGSGGGANGGGSGGGGFYGNGTFGTYGGGKGTAFISNASGGLNLGTGFVVDIAGGFGGGAGAGINTGFEADGGGGGGYSGGGGGNSRVGAGGGGGNYYNSTIILSVSDGGLNTRDGFVTIESATSAKGGTVSTTIGASPFYTNITNPYNLTLNNGESQIITWFVNATGTTPNFPYGFFVYSNQTANLSIGNQTSYLNITIKDVIAPLVNITYPLNTTYNFNISSINYTYSDYSGAGTCWYSNSSGAWNSSSTISGNNFANVYTLEGSNIFTVYCNDSSGNLNSSQITFSKDSVYPLFTTYWSNNATMNGSGTATLNVTLSNTNGTVLLYIDNTNYTATNLTSNIYNVSVSLKNNTYSYYWISWGNGSLNNYNISNSLSYTLYGTVRIVSINATNSTGNIGGVVLQGTNVTINVTVENSPSVLLKIWQGLIGGSTIWQGLMNLVSGNLWSKSLATNSSWPVGVINYTVYANDSLGYQTNSSGTFNVTDTLAPYVYLKYPINNSFVRNSTQYFSANYTDNVLLLNTTLYIWNSTNYLINSTSLNITSATNTTNISVILPYDNTFKWNYYSCDYLNNCAMNSTNFTITYDSTSPVLNITFPINTTYNSNIRTLNYTYLDINANASCWYSNSSGAWNSSLVSPGTNFTINSLENSNILTVYCNDSAGNLNSSSIMFTKLTPKIAIQLISPTGNINATQNQMFQVSVNVSCSNNDCGNINVSLDPSNTVYNFTTCGKTGTTGPSQANCYTNYTNTTLQGLVNVTNGIQNWTVPATGTYTIEVAGAIGGCVGGGKGAKMIGTFSLSAGTVLQILVGQSGTCISYGGGGGGSFVANGSNYSLATPLIAAGGGGGDSSSSALGANGTTSTNGTNGQGCSSNAGTNGSGGGVGCSSYAGGGGGGFYSSGGSSSYATGGTAFRNGGAGGPSLHSMGDGGYGGGGGNGWYGGGGGGGYSGGGGGASDNYAGGGGGSYNLGTNQNNTNGSNSGVGYVTITYSGGKGGLVSTNTSATPFYTTTQNPYQINVNNSQSQVITWSVNATGNPGNYTFFVYANQTSDLSIGNQTNQWNVTILNQTTNPPSVSIVYPTNNANYSTDISLLNYTISGSNLSRCWYSTNNAQTNSTTVSPGINFTDIQSIEGSNTWIVYCNDTNLTGSNSITFTKDTTYPIFSNYIDNNATLLGNGTALFNVTISNTNGTVLLYINNTNYTARNLTSNTYNISLSLTNGTYSYYWISWGNGSLKNYNISTIQYYSINSSLDTFYPIFSNYYDNNASFFRNGTGLFNVTITNTNGTVWLEINNTNLTARNLTSNTYNVSYYFSSNKTYSYRWWASGNGTRKLLNNSELKYYTVKNTDTTPPAIRYGPTTTSDGNYTQNSITVSIIASDANLDKIKIYLHNDSGIVNTTQSVISFTSLFSNLNDGKYYINASANDSAGNINWTTTKTIRIDTTPPRIVSLSPIDALNSTSMNQNFTFNASDSNSLNCSLYLDKTGYIGNTSVSTNLTITSNINTTLNVSNLENKTFNWFVKCTDNFGNTNQSLTRRLTIDRVPPSIGITSPKQNDTLGNIIYIYTEISDNLVGISSASFSVINNSNNFRFYNGSLNASNNWDATWNSSSLGEIQGNITISIFANDSLNNSYSINTTFRLDNVNPTIQIISPPIGTNYYNSNFNIIAIVQDSTLNHTNYTVTGTSIVQSNLTYATNTGNFSWRDSINVSNYTDGTYNLTIFARDLANNLRIVSTLFIIDKTPPQITINYPTNNLKTSETSINFRWTPTETISQSVLCNLSIDNNVLNSNIPCTSNTECSYNLDNFVWKDYNLNISCLDNATNIGSSKITFTPNWQDKDSDGIHDSIDRLNGNNNSINDSGITNLIVNISGDTNLTTFNESKEIVIYDNSNIMANFTYNFSKTVLEMENFTIKKAADYIIFDSNNQLQGTKTLYLKKTNFISICVKDSEISDISQVSENCSESDETDFTACIGNTSGITIGYISCIDDGSRIEVSNLFYSAIKAVINTTTIETPTEPTTTTSNTGSSGTPKAIEGYDFSLTPEKIDLRIRQGHNQGFILKIKNNNPNKIQINLQPSLGDFLILNQNNYTIEPKEEKTLELLVSIPNETTTKTYFGNIKIDSKGFSKTFDISLDVIPANGMFDVIVKLEKGYSSIMPGKDLKFRVQLLKLLDAASEDVKIVYNIKNSSGSTLLTISDTRAIETTLEYGKDIIIPAEFKTGKYTLETLVNYKNETAVSEIPFSVGSIEQTDLWYILGVLLFFILAASMKVYHKRRTNKEITEEDVERIITQHETSLKKALILNNDERAILTVIDGVEKDSAINFVKRCVKLSPESISNAINKLHENNLIEFIKIKQGEILIEKIYHTDKVEERMLNDSLRFKKDQGWDYEEVAEKKPEIQKNEYPNKNTTQNTPLYTSEIKQPIKTETISYKPQFQELHQIDKDVLTLINKLQKTTTIEIVKRYTKYNDEEIKESIEKLIKKELIEIKLMLHKRKVTERYAHTDKVMPNMLNDSLRFKKNLGWYFENAGFYD